MKRGIIFFLVVLLLCPAAAGAMSGGGFQANGYQGGISPLIGITSSGETTQADIQRMQLIQQQIQAVERLNGLIRAEQEIRLAQIRNSQNRIMPPPSGIPQGYGNPGMFMTVQPVPSSGGQTGIPLSGYTVAPARPAPPH